MQFESTLILTFKQFNKYDKYVETGSSENNEISDTKKVLYWNKPIYHN